jgi:type VI secretion system protein VasJ
VKNRWQWFASGKHPSVKDYFKVGEDLPMGTAFADWIAKGYQNLPAKRFSTSGLVSLRFWTGGFTRGSFVCGVVRDSSDSIGRPYPLLILGSGSVRDWEGKWQNSPYACEKTWHQMEGISTRMFHDLRQLEEEVRRIKPPEPDWTQFAQLEEEMTKSGQPCSKAIDIQAMETSAKAVSNEAVLLIPMDEYPLQDQLVVISIWLSLLKRNVIDIPKTVFMGGNQLSTYLALFRRPLLTRDFVRLWSVYSNALR